METGFALKPIARSRPRSISLPTLRSSSKTQRAEREQLVKKLKRLEAAPLKLESICSCLSNLVDLYTSINQLINTRETLLAYNQRQDHRKWIEEWLEESVAFLDVCSSTREAILLFKASVCEVQSNLRRRSSSKSHHGHGQGDFSSTVIEGDLCANYLSSAKQTKKDIKKSLSTLKLMENKLPAGSTQEANTSYEHQPFADVIMALREATTATVSVFESILSSLFEPHVSFHTMGAMKWPLLSKLVLLDHKNSSSTTNGDRSCCKSSEPDEKLDVAVASCLVLLQKLIRRKDSGEEEGNAQRLYTEMMIRCLCERLKALEKSMEGIDKKMESLFRCLIQTRVSFLNILSN